MLNCLRGIIADRERAWNLIIIEDKRYFFFPETLCSGAKQASRDQRWWSRWTGRRELGRSVQYLLFYLMLMLRGPWVYNFQCDNTEILYFSEPLAILWEFWGSFKYIHFNVLFGFNSFKRYQQERWGCSPLELGTVSHTPSRIFPSVSLGSGRSPRTRYPSCSLRPKHDQILSGQAWNKTCRYTLKSALY